MDYHTTRDGRTFRIIEMETTHLTNTALFFVRKAREISSLVNNNAANLVDGVSIDQRKASYLIEEAKIKVKDCMYELAVRGEADAIRQISDQLGILHERSSKVTFNFLLGQSEKAKEDDGSTIDEHIDFFRDVLDGEEDPF